MKEKALCNFDLIGGRLVDPSSGIDRVKDLFVRDGIIYSSLPEGKPAEKTFIIKDQIQNYLDFEKWSLLRDIIIAVFIYLFYINADFSITIIAIKYYN